MTWSLSLCSLQAVCLFAGTVYSLAASLSLENRIKLVFLQKTAQAHTGNTRALDNVKVLPFVFFGDACGLCSPGREAIVASGAGFLSFQKMAPIISSKRRF